jgi:hypothetical protein
MDPEFNLKAINLSGLKFIQHVIAKTVTPSWINSMPSNYGETNASSIKADEWWTLTTIYIPIALILLWGDQPKCEAEQLGAMLAQSMALFQAVTLVCRYSWINSVPSNYGEANAGSIKADEWRTLTTIYIPIALILLWGDQPKYEAEQLGAMLAQSMALFQAVILVCRYTLSKDCAEAFCLFLKQRVEETTSIHPHTDEHNARTNIHAAFHIYDFIILFGSIMAWWCFPFEHLIGTLQKINTNDHVGGELEGTIIWSFWRGANLQRHLNCQDCPELIKQFKVLFEHTFSLHLDRSAESVPNENGKDRAHYTHQSINYSRASTHLGNSLVIYYLSPDTMLPIAGSIQCIGTEGDTTYFCIQRQAPLPPGKFDPFLPFPHFPAKTYSWLMQNLIC